MNLFSVSNKKVKRVLGKDTKDTIIIAKWIKLLSSQTALRLISE